MKQRFNLHGVTSQTPMNLPLEVMAARRATWDATVGTTIALQWAVVLALAAIVALLAGIGAGGSLLLGGVAVAAPNALLALWLTLRLHRAGAVGAAAMAAGELAKLGLTIALLAIAVARWRADLAWLALIAGVIAALKAQWLALWLTRRM